MAIKNKHKMDVFISYSSEDREWVRGELLKRIEKAGLDAFIDFRDFKRGAPSIKEMERGIKECRKTLLILTPNYFDSGWTKLESIMAQSLDPANDNLRLIALVKNKCEISLHIKILTYIDFTDNADKDLAWCQLLNALKVPEAEDDPWFLPHLFIGRSQELARLTKIANRKRVVCIYGQAGVGKTALAVEWVKRTSNNRKCKSYYVSVNQNQSCEKIVSKLLVGLGASKDLGTTGERREALIRHLRQDAGILLFDECETVPTKN